MNGGVGVGDKPDGYARRVWTDPAPPPNFAPDPGSTQAQAA
jgi:hypothetical protein